MSASSPRSRSDAAARQWAQRLQRFHHGRQTIAAFCAAEGISKANFYLWKRRLSPEHTTHTPSDTTFVPIRVAAPLPAHFELALPSGAVLRFPGDTTPELLVAVLRGLEAQPC